MKSVLGVVVVKKLPYLLIETRIRLLGANRVSKSAMLAIFEALSFEFGKFEKICWAEIYQKSKFRL